MGVMYFVTKTGQVLFVESMSSSYAMIRNMKFCFANTLLRLRPAYGCLTAHSENLPPNPTNPRITIQHLQIIRPFIIAGVNRVLVADAAF